MKSKVKQFYLGSLALIMSLNLVGCSNEKIDKEIDVKEYDLYYDHYETYLTKEIVGDEVQQKYWAYNIVIGINKETSEISKYIYFHGDDRDYLYNNILHPSSLNGIITELFDLESGKLLYYRSYNNNELNIGEDNLEKIINENDLYFLSKYYEDIDLDYKDYYTIEEINEIANKFREKSMDVKKLELSN